MDRGAENHETHWHMIENIFVEAKSKFFIRPKISQEEKDAGNNFALIEDQLDLIGDEIHKFAEDIQIILHEEIEEKDKVNRIINTRKAINSLETMIASAEATIDTNTNFERFRNNLVEAKKIVEVLKQI